MKRLNAHLIFRFYLKYISYQLWHFSHFTGPEADADFVKQFGYHLS